MELKLVAAGRPTFVMPLLILGLCGTSPGEAQQLTPAQIETLREQARSGEQASSTEEGLGQSTPLVPTGPLLDRTISRTEYRLGPGDVLTLAIFGYRNEVMPLRVTPEGTVVVPTVGVISVDDLNLDQATERVRRRVLRFFPNSSVEVTLASVRSFHVFVVGDIPDPGRRSATAVTRVSEVVPTADQNGVIYRGIVIRRGTETLPVDLVRFLQTGSLDANPFLRQGDLIQVPVIDRTVTVAGEIAYPGNYEYREGETLAEFLRIANGGQNFLTKAADTLFLARYAENPRGIVTPILSSAAIGPVGETLRLQPFDAVYVPRLANYMEHRTARIEGEVRRPGLFPIQPNRTTVADLIEMAGGFTEEAAPGEAVIRRSRTALPTDTLQDGFATIPPEYLTPSERRVLQVTSRADESTAIIDLTSNSAAGRLPVHAGDVLLIPERREDIVVLGAVRQPGVVVFEPGMLIDDVVARAGGYTRRADRGDVVVLRTAFGMSLGRDDVRAIQPGDRVVVPFRQRTTILERVLTAQGVINTVSGVILTLVGLERLWETLSN